MCAWVTVRVIAQPTTGLGMNCPRRPDAGGLVVLSAPKGVKGFRFSSRGKPGLPPVRHLASRDHPSPSPSPLTPLATLSILTPHPSMHPPLSDPSHFPLPLSYPLLFLIAYPSLRIPLYTFSSLFLILHTSCPYTFFSSLSIIIHALFLCTPSSYSLLYSSCLINSPFLFPHTLHPNFSLLYVPFSHSSLVSLHLPLTVHPSHTFSAPSSHTLHSSHTFHPSFLNQLPQFTPHNLPLTHFPPHCLPSLFLQPSFSRINTCKLFSSTLLQDSLNGTLCPLTCMIHRKHLMTSLKLSRQNLEYSCFLVLSPSWSLPLSFKFTFTFIPSPIVSFYSPLPLFL